MCSPYEYTHLSLSYLRKAFMTLMAVGSEGFWNSLVFFSTSSFLSAPMAAPEDFLGEGMVETQLNDNLASMYAVATG